MWHKYKYVFEAHLDEVLPSKYQHFHTCSVKKLNTPNHRHADSQRTFDFGDILEVICVEIFILQIRATAELHKQQHAVVAPV